MSYPVRTAATMKQYATAYIQVQTASRLSNRPPKSTPAGRNNRSSFSQHPLGHQSPGAGGNAFAVVYTAYVATANQPMSMLMPPM
jgi:hypothetical protein